ENRVLRFQIAPPEGGQFISGGIAGGIAFSPDGRTAAYVAARNGKTELWVRPLDAAVSRPIAGTEGARFPFWSPDSKTIGVFTPSQLKRVDPGGGAPSAICDTFLARGGAWTSDSRILVGSESSSLLQVPATGGRLLPFTTLDVSRSEGMHRWPQELPGG